MKSPNSRQHIKSSSDESLAKRRIADAIRTSSKTLTLSGLALAYLPKNIENITSLEHLDVAGSELRALPEGLSRLSKLTTLNASNNNLETLPSTLGKLKRLRSLNLSRNPLTELPESVRSLKLLKTLNIWGTQLSVLPDWIGNFTELQALDVSHMNLAQLPASLSNLTKLTALDIAGNSLGVLPYCLNSLKNLEELLIYSTNLTALPSWLSSLPLLIHLDAAGNKLKSLPKSISSLSNLETLIISDNRLHQLPPALFSLSTLTNLDVSNNTLGEIPKDISRLTNLIHLNWAGNGLAALPTELATLGALVDLDISQNKIRTLPSTIGELKGIRQLNLSANQLSSLPESFRNLTNLTAFDISFNQITELSPFDAFTQLRLLNVEHNRLSQLPIGLEKVEKIYAITANNNKLKIFNIYPGQWKNINRIVLSDNNLTTLPDALSSYRSLKTLQCSRNALKSLPYSWRDWKTLDVLELDGNEDLGIPPEVLGVSSSTELTDISRQPTKPETILDYYFRARRARRPLNEAKLILVGRGGVGKTSLIKKLVHDKFNAREKETTGIEIETWPVTLMDADVVRLHVWDFGGQEILHATHQFFLTERAIYLLVLSGREGSQMLDAEYWLQLIRSFGGDSRVLIALNKAVQHPFDINRGLLMEKYKFIGGFIATDCEDGTGIFQLKERIIEQTSALEHRKTSFPSDWFAIKERLSGMEENYLTWDRYQELCRQLGEYNLTAQRDLAKSLHVLGIALNYSDDPRLRDTHVLNPRWVTDGIYTLLRAGQRANRKGILTKKVLSEALSLEKYPITTYDFLLNLMARFQLCFPLGGSSGRYLVPELLGENQPDLKDLLEERGLDFRYQYQVLPEGLVPRFIVLTHLLSDTRAELRWRSGVVLERDRCLAVVRADSDKRQIDIHVIGPETMRRGTLAIIREKFDYLHGEFRELPVDERVPIYESKDVSVSYGHLLNLEEDGVEEIYPEGIRKSVAVADLLNGVETKEVRQLRRVGKTATAGAAASKKSRGERTEMKKKTMDPEEKCRLLFLAANPKDTASLDLDVESRTIEEKIRGADYRNSLEFIPKSAVRPDDLLQYLNQYKPHVVHFSGHGSSDEQIYLLDAQGKAKPVSKTALRMLFKTMQDDIRVVVLNACYSRPQAEAIVEYIDCAIGMKRAIGDQAAIIFAAALYRAIAFGHSVQRAFDEARTSLLVEGVTEDLIPDLHVKLGIDAGEVYLIEAGGNRD